MVAVAKCMVKYVCSHYGQAEPVIKLGTIRDGATKLRCKACDKVFTPQPKAHTLTPQREAAIERALVEHVSQRGMAWQLQVGKTILIRFKSRWLA